MSIATTNAALNYGAPAWYNSEEASCFEEVRALARSLASAKYIVVENIVDSEKTSAFGEPVYYEHNQVLIVSSGEPSDDEVLRISEFNKEGHALLVAFATVSEGVEGNRYGI